MEFQAVSGPKFTGPFSSNAEGIAGDHMSFRFSISCPFRRYSRSKSEVVENCRKFCMFLAPHFLEESAPRIFGLNLSNRTSFRSCGKVSRRSVEGRRREVGERKKAKTSRAFYKSSRTTVTGGLITPQI